MTHVTSIAHWLVFVVEHREGRFVAVEVNSCQALRSPRAEMIEDLHKPFILADASRLHSSGTSYMFTASVMENIAQVSVTSSGISKHAKDIRVETPLGRTLSIGM